MSKVLFCLALLFALVFIPFSPKSAEKPEPNHPTHGQPLVAPVLAAESPGFIPKEINIPSLGLESQIEATGLDGQRIVITPEKTVGWYTQGAKANELGSVVLAGHFMLPGNVPGVFNKLAKLQVGDGIVLRGSGNEVKYKVTKLELHETGLFPLADVYGKSSGRNLRLITCAGNFDPSTSNYSHRTIVFAEQIQ